jgi:hypothetical protein
MKISLNMQEFSSVRYDALSSQIEYKVALVHGLLNSQFQSG